MSEVAETYAALKEAQAKKREANRIDSTAMLEAAKVEFTSHNNGTHLIVTTKGGLVDFWPSTGLWIDRNTKMRARGVKNLLRFWRQV